MTNEARQLRAVRAQLRSLVLAVDEVIKAVDRAMDPRLPADQRGQNVAALVNHLDLAKDMAVRFGLNGRMPKRKG